MNDTCSWTGRSRLHLMGFAHCRRPPCCWFLDASFQLTFFRHTYKFGDGFCHFRRPKPITWQAWCLHFGTLGDHFGTLGHRGRPWEQQEGRVGVWNRIFIDFRRFWDPILRFVWHHGLKKCLFFVLVSRSLFVSIFECKSGPLELKNIDLV